MKIRDFEKEIRNLDQVVLLTGTVSVLNHLLVEKGILTEEELQTNFLIWKSKNKIGLGKKKTGRKKKK